MIPLKILRPARRMELISAQTFEQHFSRSLAPAINIHRVPLAGWFTDILGPVSHPHPLPQAARKFARATEGFNFISLTYEGFPVTPLLLYLRNMSHARVRFLTVAHAPGVSGWEWALMLPLLAPGDAVVAPSLSAEKVIKLFCPAYEKYIHVIPHPVPPLPKRNVAKKRRFATLCRLHEDKLLHRQIEAVAILKKRRKSAPLLQIAGPIRDNDGYVRSLTAKIHRLNLTEHVQLVGTISGQKQKSGFLSGATACINLSVTLEESFGKTVVEALSTGTPVIITAWDGLPETAGDAGKTVPVCAQALDAAPEKIASAMEQMLEVSPSAEACLEQASIFAPQRVRVLYRDACERLAASAETHHVPEAPDELSAAPAQGVLGCTAPLTQFSWKEIFKFHVEETQKIRCRWEGKQVERIMNAERLRTLLIASTQVPVGRVLAGKNPEDVGQVCEREWETPPVREPFTARLVNASSSTGSLGSRLVCLSFAHESGEHNILRKGLQELQPCAGAVYSFAFRYLTSANELANGNFLRAFAICTGLLKNMTDRAETVHALRLLSKICRQWAKPQKTLPYFQKWLGRFPDSPESGIIWMEYSFCSIRSGKRCHVQAKNALERARFLLGELPVLQKMNSLLTVKHRNNN